MKKNAKMRLRRTGNGGRRAGARSFKNLKLSQVMIINIIKDYYYHTDDDTDTMIIIII